MRLRATDVDGASSVGDDLRTMRLTPLSKMFIAIVVLGVVGYTGWHYWAGPKKWGDGGATSGVGGATGAPTGAKPEGGEKPPVKRRSPKTIIVGVNDFGGAYPGVVANDGASPGPKSRFTAAGLDVEIRLIRGSKERLQAFDSGEVDVMLLTLDYFANLVPQYKKKNIDLKSFFMADWSRGNLGVVAKPSIKSIEGLKDAKVATTRNTPTHYVLLSLLQRSNLSAADVEKAKGNIVFATKTPQAGDMFRRGEVDAVAIWEPHLSQSMAGGKGRLLVSTATATNLIADVLFARTEWIKEHEADLAPFIRAWLEGVNQLEKDPESGVALIAKAFGQTLDETRDTLKKIKPATFADNRAFFGLERENAPYIRLFDDASKFWKKEGVIDAAASAPETRWLKALEMVAKEHVEEKVVENYKFSGPAKDATPLLTKSVSIYFASGQDKLDPNAKKLIDTFADMAAEFGNAYVRVEGNTDNVGARASNLKLSEKRARSVVDYLTKQHGFDRARFQAVGNGPDKPTGDNATTEGRDMNRRTDFQIIPNQ
jgi:NitT/TauT family transport system substrate-binding protein